MGLLVSSQGDRVLHAYPVAASEQGLLAREAGQKRRKPGHAKGMPPPDRRHLHHLPIYELYPVVLGEDADLAHLSVLLDGEAMPYGAHLKSPYGSRLPTDHPTGCHAGMWRCNPWDLAPSSW